MRLKELKARIYDNIISILINNYYKNIEVELQRIALNKTAEYILKNMREVQSVKTRYDVIDRAIQETSIKEGLILEFGVFKGESINYIAKKFPDEIVYGFDSFEGLPGAWRDGFDKGSFQIKNLANIKFEKNITLIKGYFNETLPVFFKEHTLPIKFMHIDSDLYSSAVTIFNNVLNQIKSGTVIVFDEFFNYPGFEEGEFKAFHEFITQTQLSFKFITYNRRHEQVAVKIL